TADVLDGTTRLYPETSTVFRVTLPTGEQFLTQDVALVDTPVYRCTMPNGTEALLEPPGDCQHCRPEVHRVGRRRNEAVVMWMCSGGCGYHPVTGSPIGGAT